MNKDESNKDVNHFYGLLGMALIVGGGLVAFKIHSNNKAVVKAVQIACDAAVLVERDKIVKALESAGDIIDAVEAS